MDKEMKAITKYVHYLISEKIKHLSITKIPKILDIGGNGKLQYYYPTSEYTQSDGRNLPYPNDCFDVTTSIAVLEHVEGGIEGRQQFLNESIRISKESSIHFTPAGKIGQAVEDLKATYGHYHPCSIPSSEEFLSLPASYEMYSCVTVGEHLMCLASMYENLNIDPIYSFIRQYANKPYGYILVLRK